MGVKDVDKAWFFVKWWMFGYNVMFFVYVG
jgi:hypothetical protein